MKTTFDLPQSLVDDVKRIARDRGTTARDVVQQALVRVVDEDAAGASFVLHDASVSGWRDLVDGAAGVSLNDLIRASYGREEKRA